MQHAQGNSFLAIAKRLAIVVNFIHIDRLVQ